MARRLGLFACFSGAVIAARECSNLTDMSACADSMSCFPHHSWSGMGPKCLPAEAVSCSGAPPEALSLFCSDGLSNRDLRHALRHLVLRLLKGRKDAARHEALARNVTELARRRFQEPELYGGLKAMVISDACYLKQFETDPWPCEDYKPVLVSLGFAEENIAEVNLFDMRRRVQNLSSENSTVHNKSWEEMHKSIRGQIEDLMQMKAGRFRKNLFERLWAWFGQADLADTYNSMDLIAVNGGSPDFLNFAFSLSRILAKRIVEDVKAGRTIYLGRSAGAMVGAADIGLTVDTDPTVFEDLGVRQRGLRLIGNCSIRPHYTEKLWDKATHAYADVLGLNVVRVPNGEGLMCERGRCRMVGMSHIVVWTGPHNNATAVLLRKKDATPHAQGPSVYSQTRRYTLSADHSLEPGLRRLLPAPLVFEEARPGCRLCELHALRGELQTPAAWEAQNCTAACLRRRRPWSALLLPDLDDLPWKLTPVDFDLPQLPPTAGRRVFEVLASFSAVVAVIAVVYMLHSKVTQRRGRGIAFRPLRAAETRRPGERPGGTSSEDA